MDVPGFSSVKTSDGNEKVNQETFVQKSGFHGMGLSLNVLRGILKRGYKSPTPIQRKTIPLILEGRDVVAMAKTGSGKTACFLIPLLEKLNQREYTKGARALIFSPTRELAIQTFKFFRELGRFLDLQAILVLGGDSIDSQFSAIHTAPDIIIATPGRFLHLCIEMNLKLTSIGYVVFDEADRLFEMGFGVQLNEIIRRLPTMRQTILLSATLPKTIVDFANVGLSDPTLIRLDVESKLPESLVLKFIYCRPDDRYSAVLTLLKHAIPEEVQALVFAGTQYHVELISYILDEAGVSNTSIYSNMDPAARKINSAKFINKKVRVLVVTDIVARGIDIPCLDFVINFHFPVKPKLFIHRVGRCARAGRSGTAFSIFSTDDEAHLLDLHLFLNKPLALDIYTIPDDVLEEEHRTMLHCLNNHHIDRIFKTCENAYKKYLNMRPSASIDSNKKCKEISFAKFPALDELMRLEPRSNSTEIFLNEKKEEFLNSIQNYRPKNTIFEVNAVDKSSCVKIMKQKRIEHSDRIRQHRQINGEERNRNMNVIKKNETTRKRLSIEASFEKYDEENDYYISYEPHDKRTEEALTINSFNHEARDAQFSIIQGKETYTRGFGTKKWDRVKKKMVSLKDPREGRIKTESGTWIPATYKTNRYKEWKEKTKIGQNHSSSKNDNMLLNAKKYLGKKVLSEKQNSSKPELKNREQIVKKRLRVEIAKQREMQNKLKKGQGKKQRHR